MSVWIHNFSASLENRLVIILHGNVRDKYIDENGQVYENLTELLRTVAGRLPLSFSEIVFYDPVGHERRSGTIEKRTVDAEKERDASPSEQRPTPKASPTRVLANWVRQLTMTDQNRFVTAFYIDKLISYKTSYQDDEREILLWLEKLIENITPNHRLILVALQDTLVPIELYTNSPKTYVLPIPLPDKEDRLAYLKHRLGDDQPHRELIADLTDGLYLRDLDNIVTAFANRSDLSVRDVHRLVNKYRIGEQEDHWGALKIERLKNAENWFVEEEGVKGQEEAIVKVKDMLCKARAGLSGIASGTASKPKGVLFFAGPTGVGKTFVAKKLAKFLFSTEEAFVRFDMSEFKEEHTVSKLIGSPPGYVGYERGGMLTNSVRERPFSVILFDEIEKAHPKIMDIFLQILDDGRLTDSRGQTVFFTETVIIFTSNLGTRTTDSTGHPTDERDELDSIMKNTSLNHKQKKDQIREHFTRAVEGFFMFEISRPELLNRIGNNVVPFNHIHSTEVQKEIVNSHLKRIKAYIEDAHRISQHKVIFDDSVAQWLVEKFGDQMAEMGGRGITSSIDDKALTPLSYPLLEAEEKGEQGVTFRVTADSEGIVVMTE